MGNRAVITTQENFDNNGVGIYLHWNGGRDSVNGFLTYCAMMNFRAPSDDPYGWSYLTTIICNFFGDGLSCGVDNVNKLDCDNGDNGVYIIDGWNIVDRKYFEGEEQNEYPLNDILVAIRDAQPKQLQVDDKFFDRAIRRTKQ